MESGIFAVDAESNLHDLNVQSVFMLEKQRIKFSAYGNRLFVAALHTITCSNFRGCSVANIELIVS